MHGLAFFLFPWEAIPALLDGVPTDTADSTGDGLVL